MLSQTKQAVQGGHPDHNHTMNVRWWQQALEQFQFHKNTVLIVGPDHTRCTSWYKKGQQHNKISKMSDRKAVRRSVWQRQTGSYSRCSYISSFWSTSHEMSYPDVRLHCSEMERDYPALEARLFIIGKFIQRHWSATKPSSSCRPCLSGTIMRFQTFKPKSQTPKNTHGKEWQMYFWWGSMWGST